MHKIIKHLLDSNEKQEKEIKVIKTGILITGIATAVGIGLTIINSKINSKRKVHFVKKRIKMEEVGSLKSCKNRTQKINIIEED